jgi:hypothetical protein
MTQAVISSATTDNEHNATLFVKITAELEAEIQDAARRTGVSKSGLVRMALPLGIARLMERLSSEQP